MGRLSLRQAGHVDVLGAVDPHAESDGEGAYALSGSGDAELLVDRPGFVFPLSWSPDGRYLLYNHSDPDSTGPDLWYVPLLEEANAVTTDGVPQVFLRTQFGEGRGRLSPDGRYLAFESNESGQDETYVLSFPGGSGKRQISSDGGRSPRWNPRGGELFYLSQGAMMTVPVETDGVFRPGRSRKLFDAPPGVNLNGFDVSRDGRRFLSVSVEQQADEVEERPKTIITVVQNWAKEFERQE